MTHASLCTGIGACELAATWMRWENLFSCEVDEFCNRVLKHHYPKAKHYGNIFEQDFREWRGRVDVLTAGFPCQPFSCAGKRNGAKDDRYLWPEVLRVINEVRPAWFIGENVAGIISMVLPGEEITVGSYEDICGESYEMHEKRQRYVIEQIRLDLASIGYSVQPVVYQLVPSERPTGEAGYGSLLPTIQTQGMKVCDRNGKTRFVDLSLLPTPAAQDFKRRGPNSKQQGLPEAAYNGLLPTPNATEGEKFAKTYNPNSQMGQSLTVLAVNGMIKGTTRFRTGKGSLQLNPLFVQEMMGYPEDYLVSPFLNGDNNQ